MRIINYVSSITLKTVHLSIITATLLYSQIGNICLADCKANGKDNNPRTGHNLPKDGVYNYECKNSSLRDDSFSPGKPYNGNARCKDCACGRGYHDENGNK